MRTVGGIQAAGSPRAHPALGADLEKPYRLSRLLHPCNSPLDTTNLQLVTPRIAQRQPVHKRTVELAQAQQAPHVAQYEHAPAGRRFDGRDMLATDGNFRSDACADTAAGEFAYVSYLT